MGYDRLGDGSIYAVEWSNGKIINLGSGIAQGINDLGQIVGGFGSSESAIEWSDGKVINLGILPGFQGSAAQSINDNGQVVGSSSRISAPEPSTWAMMAIGFAALGFVGYRRAKQPFAA